MEAVVDARAIQVTKVFADDVTDMEMTTLSEKVSDALGGIDLVQIVQNYLDECLGEGVVQVKSLEV